MHIITNNSINLGRKSVKQLNMKRIRERELRINEEILVHILLLFEKHFIAQARELMQKTTRCNIVYVTKWYKCHSCSQIAREESRIF